MKKNLHNIVLACALMVLTVQCLEGVKESFDSLKRSLDKSIEEVGKDIESNDLKKQIALLTKVHASDNQTILESIRRKSFKALLASFSDTCIPAGSGKTMLHDRLRLLETSLSVYAGFLSRIAKKLDQSKIDTALRENILLIRYELKEVLYWKDFIHEALSK